MQVLAHLSGRGAEEEEKASLELQGGVGACRFSLEEGGSCPELSLQPGSEPGALAESSASKRRSSCRSMPTGTAGALMQLARDARSGRLSRVSVSCSHRNTERLSRPSFSTDHSATQPVGASACAGRWLRASPSPVPALRHDGSTDCGRRSDEPSPMASPRESAAAPGRLTVDGDAEATGAELSRGLGAEKSEGSDGSVAPADLPRMASTLSELRRVPPRGSRFSADSHRNSANRNSNGPLGRRALSFSNEHVQLSNRI